MTSHFKIKDLGLFHYFLGIEVSQSQEGIVINQHKYALELIQDVGLLGGKPALIPMPQNLKMTSYDYDVQFHSNETYLDPLIVDVELYKLLVGRFLYLAIKRPNISFSVQRLS